MENNISVLHAKTNMSESYSIYITAMFYRSRTRMCTHTHLKSINVFVNVHI